MIRNYKVNYYFIIEQFDSCMVCNFNFTTNDIVSNLPCACLFHAKCIKKYLQFKNICPECQFDVDIEDITNRAIKC